MSDFFCPGCQRSRPRNGAAPVLLAGGMVTVCESCKWRVDPIRADEQLELHEQLESVTDFRQLFGKHS